MSRMMTSGMRLLWEGYADKMKFLQIPAVAALFGVSESWVYRHWREIGGFKLGGRVMFRLDKLEAYIIGLEDGYQVHNEERPPLEIPLYEKRQVTSGPGISDGDRSKGRRSQSEAYTINNCHGLPIGCRGTIS